MPFIDSLGRISENRRPWYDTRTIFQDCSSGSCGVYLSDGTPIAPHRAAGAVVGRAPRWAASAWIEHDAPGVSAYKGLFAWNGDFPGRALCADDAGPNGEYAWAWHDSDGAAFVTDADGRDWPLTTAAAYSLQLHGGTNATWLAGNRPASNFVTPPDRYAWSLQYSDGHWLWQDIESGGALVLDGHVIQPPAATYFYIALRKINGNLMVAWSPNQADTQAQVRVYTPDEVLTYPRVDAVTPPDPPEPPVPIETVPDLSAFVRDVVGPKLRWIQGDEGATRDATFAAVNAGCLEARKTDLRWGLLEKIGGPRDRASDIWLYDLGDGTAQVVDIVGDSEGHDGPPTVGWSLKDIRSKSQWRVPFNDTPQPPQPPDPPDPPDPGQSTHDLVLALGRHLGAWK